MDTPLATLRRIWPFTAEPGWAALLGVAGSLMLAVPILQSQLTLDWRPDVAADRLAAALASDVDRDIRRFDLVQQTVMAAEPTPASKDLSSDERNALLSSRVPRDANISFLDVLNADGSVQATLQPERPASNWSRQDYFTLQRDNTANILIVGQPYSLTHENDVGFTISRRISDRDNRFAGVIVLGIRLAHFLDQFGSHELGSAESVTLLDTRGGQVLMRVPFDLKAIGHPVEPFEPFQAFMRSEPPPYTAQDKTDHVERRFVFHRAGDLPLAVMVTTRVPDRYTALLRWGLPGATALGLASVMLLLRARRTNPGRRPAIWP